MAGFGLSVYLSRGEPLKALGDRLRQVRDAGFTHAEIGASSLDVVIDGKLHPSRLDHLQQALEGNELQLTLHGTEIASARGGNLMDVTTPAQRLTVEADIALAHAVGATVLVYHSGMLRDEGGDADAVARGMHAERQQLRELADIAAESGVKIAVENRDPVSRYIARHAYGIDLLRLAEQVVHIDHPNVGICFDTGHAFLGCAWKGADYLGEVRQIASLVSHIHVSDNFGKVMLDQQNDTYESLIQGLGDLHLMPGWGRVPFDEIAAIPFPQQPVSILELRGSLEEHLVEAAEVTGHFARALQRSQDIKTH